MKSSVHDASSCLHSRAVARLHRATMGLETQAPRVEKAFPGDDQSFNDSAGTQPQKA